jgi:hypothetical protein
VPQRSIKHEEDASKDNNYANTKQGSTSSNGTSPRASSGGPCAGIGGKEEHGAKTSKVHKNDQRGDHSASFICAQRKDRAGSNTSKGTHK